MNKSRGATAAERRAANNAYSRRWRQQNPEKAKAFVKEATLKKKYGLTQAAYDALLVQQKGVCAACGGLPKSKRALDVDHCHESGVIRGLLCASCNIALGLLRECPARMDALKTYINNFRWLK